MRRADAGKAFEKELLEEKVSSLKRVAGRLEQALERLRAFDAGGSGPEAQRQALRRDAEQKLWNLLVQREAIGLRRHEDIYRVYGVPADLVARP